MIMFATSMPSWRLWFVKTAFAATYLNLFDSNLGIEGVFCRCRRLQRIRLSDRIRRQPEASAASSETSQMQGDTRLLLGSCTGL